MRIARVRVRNIRSYTEADLPLGPGTTLLEGDVGSGKTSLLYAIEMALFGTAEVDATHLLRHGATESEVAVVLEDDGRSVEFSRTFRRVHRRGRETFEPGRTELTTDGRTTAYSSTELRQRVIDLLGFRDNPNPRAHSDVWRWAVYVPQERMREILSAPAQDRLETIRRALGVERYRTAATNAREVARDLRTRAGALREQGALLARFTEEFAAAAREVTELEAEIVRLTESHARGEEELRLARDAVEAIDRTLAGLVADRRELETLRRQREADERLLAEISADTAHRTQELDRLRAELGGLTASPEEVASAAAEVRSRESELGDLRARVEAAAVALEGVRARRARLVEREDEVLRREAELARRESELADLGSPEGETPEGEAPAPDPPTALTATELDSRLGESRSAESRWSEELAVARRSLEELDRLIDAGVCPRCGQAVHAESFGPHRSEAAEALAGIERAQSEARADRVQWESLRSARERYDRARREWEVAQDRRRELGRFRETALETRQEAARALDAARAERDALATELAQSSPAGEALDSLRALVRAAEAASSTARERAGTLERQGERRRSIEERLGTLRGAAESARRRSEELEGRRSQRNEEIRRLEEMLLREGQHRAERDAAERRRRAAESDWHRLTTERTRRATQLESARERRGRAEAGDRERQEILRSAQEVGSKAEWLAGAFHDALLTIETRVLERAQADFSRYFRRYFAALVDDPDLVAVTDASFQPGAEIRGEFTPAEALSGGERTSLALAYRLALSRVVRGLGGLRLDSLLLDEPTDGFSPEQVQSMGQLIEEIALPQVVLVSHERGLEAIADRVVRVEKSDGRSALRSSPAGASSGEDGGGAAPSVTSRPPLAAGDG